MQLLNVHMLMERQTPCAEYVGVIYRFIIHYYLEYLKCAFIGKNRKNLGTRCNYTYYMIICKGLVSLNMIDCNMHVRIKE